MTRAKRRQLEKRRRLKQAENRRMRSTKSMRIDDVCWLEEDRRQKAAGPMSIVFTVVAPITLILAILAKAIIR